MIGRLQNLLFEFETFKNQSKFSFLSALTDEIVGMVEKLKEKGLIYTLTPYERKVIEEVVEISRLNTLLGK